MATTNPPDANSPDTTDPIDETSEESFPASDPPAWTGTHAGAAPEHRSAPPPPHLHSTFRSVRCAESTAAIAARLERAILHAGMKLFARIDQAEEARVVGLSMRPNILFLFGNPKGGTPIMIAHPTVAIDLPLKAVVWEDTEGATWLTYNTPALLEERHGLDPKMAAMLASVGALLEQALTP